METVAHSGFHQRKALLDSTFEVKQENLYSVYQVLFIVAVHEFIMQCFRKQVNRLSVALTKKSTQAILSKAHEGQKEFGRTVVNGDAQQEAEPGAAPGDCARGRGCSLGAEARRGRNQKQTLLNLQANPQMHYLETAPTSGTMSVI